MDPILIELGPFNVTKYAACIALGAFVAFFFIRREWKIKKLNVDVLDDFFLYVILVGFVGARTWYVLFNLDYYLSNPSHIIAIWEGGLAIHGGLIAGGIFAWYYFKKHQIDFFDAADSIMPFVLLAQAFGRWGNFFNQEAHGGPTTLTFLQNLHLPQFIIDGMYINNVYYQPTFLYESAWDLTGCILLYFLARNINYKKGQIFASYFIYYSIGRFFIEGLRTDSLYVGPLRTAQVTSLVMIAFGTLVIIYLQKKGQPSQFKELNKK